MVDSFDFLVVGKGMMGAAAARYLALTGARVALVGPDEPADRTTHDGVFASHYDNGRITRTIDMDRDWALLARRSIARYGAIETGSGVAFYSEAGCLIAAPAPGDPYDYLEQVISARDTLAVDAPLLSHQEMMARFPWFKFPEGFAGMFEARGAGHINPRALVDAQTRIFVKNGGMVVASEVSAVSERAGQVEVVTIDGTILRAGRVLVATGGFSLAKQLLPRPLDLAVKARTVLFAEVGEAQLADFATMPSLIGSSSAQSESYYVLPPIRYPDGRAYLKIGGDPSDIVLGSEAEVRAWFRSGGNPAAASHLLAVLRALMPDFAPKSLHAAPCVTTFTRHGYPYIGLIDGTRIGVLTGGNGAAAKSSDEIGRLGAALLLDGRLDAPEYGTDFSLHYR
ncbi:NAD(P)/FAD-dependent oxidoreductase [Pararhizobium antarcticum]|uniref:FAD-dependent oxidoreductase n=1 Tax=Pararhizobium antarcticum TaxID=1798805 RepID=A0A657LSI7_9HYPH|nr:FAD-binding oxidoreductase [Pararhizobium antarcticum]OJF97314.1 FAD-dependent oxidoreductase [Pararhizobium antarcticum]OJG00333.1 FAD-dependent oxidoreductase [Rhizobium sp. 58]